MNIGYVVDVTSYLTIPSSGLARAYQHRFPDSRRSLPPSSCKASAARLTQSFPTTNICKRRTQATSTSGSRN